MKSTREMIEVMEAYERGEEIESIPKHGREVPLGDGESLWQPTKHPVWDWPRIDYRIKPKAQYRPWKRGEVPVGHLLRTREIALNRWLIVADCDTVRVVNDCGPLDISYDSALKRYEHSTDGGKTWKICGVLCD